jgi:diamine N-acetyltransferase
MVVIRPAKGEDLIDLRNLALRIFVETFESANNPEDFKAYVDEAFSENRIASEFLENGSQFFVAMEGKTMIGYARVRENDEANELLGPNHLELQRLYVEIPWQGKGIANQLMETAEHFAKAKSKEWLWLGVWEHNPKGQRYYFKHGYEKFSEHCFMVGNDPQTDWLLKKAMK